MVFVMNQMNGHLLSTTYDQPVLLDIGAVLLLNTVLVPGQLATHLSQSIKYRILHGLFLKVILRLWMAKHRLLMVILAEV